MRARIRDTEIYFDIDGVGLAPDGRCMRERVTAFLNHGGPGSDHSAFKERLGTLSEKMQLVYFDHRGQGRSARGNPDRYTLDENVEDMEMLRQHLGLEQIVSIGASYGGMVAMAHAARYPKSVSSLILLVTAAHSGYVQRATQIAVERGTAAQIWQCEDLFAGRIDSDEKLRRYFEVMGSLYARKSDPQSAQLVLDRTILSAEALNRAHGPGGFLRIFDLRPELPAITAHTLILGARYDWICAPEFSAEIHQLIRRSELQIFEESGHSIMGDEPKKVIDAIERFVFACKAASCGDQARAPESSLDGRQI